MALLRFVGRRSRARDGVTCRAPRARQARGREDLPAIAGVDWAFSWPSFIPLASGGTGLAFRDGRSIPRFASGTDGKKFVSPKTVTAKQAAMATVAELADGTLVYTYQYSTDANPMIPVAILSHDHGATWSPSPIMISDAVNTHDTSILPRADGGADLYYIYPPDDHGFSLYRRRIGADGALGTEQRLTASATGEPSKPRAIRLASGKVLVAYADIAERSPDLQPKVQQLVLAELPGDAPTGP